MPELPDVVLWSVPAFVLLTFVEMISHRNHTRTTTPLRVATPEHAAIARDLAAADGWYDRLRRLFLGPGWTPAAPSAPAAAPLSGEPAA